MKLNPAWRLVAFCAILAAFTAVAGESPVEQQIQLLQDEWAEIFYHLPEDKQAEKFEALLPRIKVIEARHPDRAEPLILEAVVLCTYAAADWGISSLVRLKKARELLIKSIDLDPKAMEASAFITLGNLYFRLPGWPISYGDSSLGRQYLEAAAKLYPHALDANYFLGDYWLHEHDYDRALPYLEKADKAPVRPNQRLSDLKIKDELTHALAAARKHKAPHTDFFSGLLPSFDD